jgi:hypothetical protein
MTTVTTTFGCVSTAPATTLCCCVCIGTRPLALLSFPHPVAPPFPSPRVMDLEPQHAAAPALHRAPSCLQGSVRSACCECSWILGPKCEFARASENRVRPLSFVRVCVLFCAHFSVDSNLLHCPKHHSPIPLRRQIFHPHTPSPPTRPQPQWTESGVFFWDVRDFSTFG